MNKQEKTKKLLSRITAIILFVWAAMEFFGFIWVVVFSSSSEAASQYIGDAYAQQFFLSVLFGLMVGIVRLIAGIIILLDKQWIKYAIIILGAIAMANAADHLPIGIADYIFGAIVMLSMCYTLFSKTDSEA